LEKTFGLHLNGVPDTAIIEIGNNTAGHEAARIAFSLIFANLRSPGGNLTPIE
jgi:hypothetical protein